MTDTILTLRQFAAADWHRMASEYGVTLTEARDLYPVDSYESDWFSHVLTRVNAGDLPSWRLWRSLTDHQRSHVLRVPRALRDNDFTRQLVNLSARS